MTPHVAGLGETWRSDMMETAARNVLRFLQGEKIENRVDVDAYLM
jgi:phosphoglycerate dehydrogenase-like enzyme